MQIASAVQVCHMLDSRPPIPLHSPPPPLLSLSPSLHVTHVSAEVRTTCVLRGAGGFSSPLSPLPPSQGSSTREHRGAAESSAGPPTRSSPAANGASNKDRPPVSQPQPFQVTEQRIPPSQVHFPLPGACWSFAVVHCRATGPTPVPTWGVGRQRVPPSGAGTPCPSYRFSLCRTSGTCAGKAAALRL